MQVISTGLALPLAWLFVVGSVGQEAPPLADSAWAVIPAARCQKSLGSVRTEAGRTEEELWKDGFFENREDCEKICRKDSSCTSFSYGPHQWTGVGLFNGYERCLTFSKCIPVGADDTMVVYVKLPIALDLLNKAFPRMITALAQLLLTKIPGAEQAFPVLGIALTMGAAFLLAILLKFVVQKLRGLQADRCRPSPGKLTCAEQVDAVADPPLAKGEENLWISKRPEPTLSKPIKETFSGNVYEGIIKINQRRKLDESRRSYSGPFSATRESAPGIFRRKPSEATASES